MTWISGNQQPSNISVALSTATAAGEAASPWVPSGSAMWGILPGQSWPDEAAKARGVRLWGRSSETRRNATLDQTRGRRRGDQPKAAGAGRHTSSEPSTDGRAKARRRKAPRPRRREVLPTSASALPGVAIIAGFGDRLAHLVSSFLQADGVPVWELMPEQLDRVEIRAGRGRVTLNGRPVEGLLLRAPAFGRGHVAHDLTKLASTSATWLAAASASAVHAINSYDADAWRQGANWSVWGNRLGESGVPVHAKDRSPSRPTHTSVVSCGHIVSGPDGGTVLAAAEILEASGVRLATITTTVDDGTVVDVDTQPQFDDSSVARKAAVHVTEYLVAA